LDSGSRGDVTLLLHEWRRGDQGAFDKLMPLVYRELHRLAHKYMVREQAGNALQTTALLNEAYLRLVDLKRVQWQDRVHFFAVSARMMRRVLVEYARSRRAHKRGGDLRKIELDEEVIPCIERGVELRNPIQERSKGSAAASREIIHGRDLWNVCSNWTCSLAPVVAGE
jgi:RNA polymerase sigma factor (TIGR02999 family)